MTGKQMRAAVRAWNRDFPRREIPRAPTVEPRPPFLTHKRHGRRQPYTAAGIRRLPCFRCGNPARHQWQVCADGGLFRPICLQCDITLNEITLHWMGDPDAAAKVQAYREKNQ